jgi:hypothetical protein
MAWSLGAFVGDPHPAPSRRGGRSSLGAVEDRRPLPARAKQQAERTEVVHGEHTVGSSALAVSHALSDVVTLQHPGLLRLGVGIVRVLENFYALKSVNAVPHLPVHGTGGWRSAVFESGGS